MSAPRLVWFRRDLRLADHPALTAALAGGGPVIPLFVLDPETEALGAAAKWRLGLGIGHLAERLEGMGSRLVLRRGPAPEALRRLVAETGAVAVHWSRLYAPAWMARDRAVGAALKADGIGAEGHYGHLLHEPWAVETGAGGFYRVFTPFSRALAQLDPVEPLTAPGRVPAPETWPASDRLEDWALGAAMRRGAAVVAPYARVGEAAALEKLDGFLRAALRGYREDRDRPDLGGTSRLSENLTLGEISPRTIWQAASRALEQGAAGAETFLKELMWRDFAWHLLWHTPHIETEHWRGEWEGFPWRGDNPDAERWRRGMTGEPMVDAGMRELYVTGTMHNRVRMLAASYLCKHLLTHWKVGVDWFADCLMDWDPASNAMGWQWVAGTGPDAAPYFRVFNPATQAEKFDPDGVYRRRFVSGFQGSGEPEARRFFDAIPVSWGMKPEDEYPRPVISLDEGRKRALAAYEAHAPGKRAPAGQGADVHVRPRADK